MLGDRPCGLGVSHDGQIHTALELTSPAPSVCGSGPPKLNAGIAFILDPPLGPRVQSGLAIAPGACQAR